MATMQRHLRTVTPSAVSRWWHGRLGYRLLVELILLASLLLAYKYVRYLARDSDGSAFDNARRILDLEQSLGLAVEGSIQNAALRSRGFVAFINQYYVASHFIVTAGVMMWVYIRRPGVYARVRWVLVGITVAALAIHVAFPLAPPRMISTMGLVDTLKAYGPSIYGSPSDGAANQFAALPSLHFGYAALAAWAILLSFRSRWRYLALIHPVFMLFSIMATANHFWIDAAAAGLLLAAVGAVVWWLVSEPILADEQRDPDADGDYLIDITDAGHDAGQSTADGQLRSDLIDA